MLPCRQRFILQIFWFVMYFLEVYMEVKDINSNMLLIFSHDIFQKLKSCHITSPKLYNWFIIYLILSVKQLIANGNSSSKSNQSVNASALLLQYMWAASLLFSTARSWLPPSPGTTMQEKQNISDHFGKEIAWHSFANNSDISTLRNLITV